MTIFRTACGVLAIAGVAAGQPAIKEQWRDATSPWFDLFDRGGGTARSQYDIVDADDGGAAQLLLAKGAAAGPGGGPDIESKAAYTHGNFSARLKTADCADQPDAGVVTGLFTYFNDGSDLTGDGLPDNSEIDFEWLCAQPQTVYLTMWTDYRASDAHHKRVSRVIDLEAGKILSTRYFQAFDEGTALTGSENQPDTVPAVTYYNSSASLYEYGFSWESTRVAWWMKTSANTPRIVLWDYQGPAARITARASNFILNVWHTPDWTPPGKPSAIAAPTAPVSAVLDWIAYDPAPFVSVRPRASGGKPPGPQAGIGRDAAGRLAGPRGARSPLPGASATFFIFPAHP
jgi:hypothetical protein